MKFQAFNFFSCSVESEDTKAFSAAGDANDVFKSVRLNPTSPIKCMPIENPMKNKSKKRPVYNKSAPINGKKYSPTPTGNSFIRLNEAFALSSSIINSCLSKSIERFTIKNQPAKNALTIKIMVINNKIAEKRFAGAC